MVSESMHEKVEREIGSALSTSSAINTSPPISEWEFDHVISSLISLSAAGHDGISAAMVKHCLPLIKTQLLAVFNACLILCFFPDQWKTSKVTIIGKLYKQSYSDFSSFRPISLACTFSKCIEKIVLNRLLWFSRTQKWLSPDQHGFREAKSTKTAGHALVSHIESGFDEKISACAFLDIKSAFDSAWHPAIISALSSDLAHFISSKSCSAILHTERPS